MLNSNRTIKESDSSVIGKRQVQRIVMRYNLDLVIAGGGGIVCNNKLRLVFDVGLYNGFIGTSKKDLLWMTNV